VVEKELEDYVCAHITDVLDEYAVFIARQVPLVHGRLDILACDGSSVYVIELKVKPLKEKDVGQVLRYTADVEKAVGTVVYSLIGKMTKTITCPSLMDKIWFDKLGKLIDASNDKPLMQPMLVGPSVDETVIAAASGGRVRIQTYTEEAGGIAFESAYNHETSSHYSLHRPNWAYQIADLLLTEVKEETQWQFDRCVENLFAPKESR